MSNDPYLGWFYQREYRVWFTQTPDVAPLGKFHCMNEDPTFPLIRTFGT